MAGRDSLEITIYGMEGVPPSLIEGKYQEVLKKTKLESKEDKADPSKFNPFNGLSTPFISTGGLPIVATASQIVKGQMHAVDTAPNLYTESTPKPPPPTKQTEFTIAPSNKEKDKVVKCSPSEIHCQLVFDSALSAEELLSADAKYK